MNNKIVKLLENAFSKTGERHNIEEFKGITKIFPNDYREFLNFYNGGNGNISENAYLHLWAYENIEEFNNDYCVAEFLTDVVLIGSDGGDTAYGINSKGQFIEVPFIAMDDEKAVIADSFDDFINRLSEM